MSRYWYDHAHDLLMQVSVKTEDTRIWHCENTDPKIITCILVLDIMFFNAKNRYYGVFRSICSSNKV